MTDPDAPVGIDAASLALVARRALDQPDAELLDWRATPLGGGMGASLGAGELHRVSGTALVEEFVCPWSLVRKRLRPPAGGNAFSLSGDDPGVLLDRPHTNLKINPAAQPAMRPPLPFRATVIWAGTRAFAQNVA
jgi:hypothetical protein